MRRLTTNKYIKTHMVLYVMMIPALLYTLIFKLVPMYGMIIAFKDYNIFGGDNAFDSISQSEWIGFKNFLNIFNQPDFLRVLGNTFIIAFMKLIFLFPIPVIIALLLSELVCHRFKKIIQTIIYLPHFFSWVVVAGIAINIFGTTGMINQVLIDLGFGKINFLLNGENFRWLLVVTDGWKEAGFSAVVYIAAISSINPDIYEAAEVDGASRFQRMIKITLPSIIPTVLLMLILKVGKMLEENFQQILVLYNSSVYDYADVIQTYVYRMGLGQMDFTLGVTVGLFNSVVSLALILFSNFICKKLLGRSVW